MTDIECEARDREQLVALIEALQAKGYSVSEVELFQRSSPAGIVRGLSRATTLRKAWTPRDRTGSLSPLLRDEPGAVPVSARQDRAEGVHRAQGSACRRAQRRAWPDRVPPQPDGRLSPQLRQLPGLRFGPRGRGRVPPLGHPEAQFSPQCRPDRDRMPGRPASSSNCSSCTSPRAIRAAEWPRWTKPTSPTWSSIRR